jgi:hypothetical protein
MQYDGERTWLTGSFLKGTFMVNSISLVAVAQQSPSMLMWILQSIGSPSQLIALFSAGIVFLGALYFVATNRPLSVLASYLILLPLPLSISICGILNGMIRSYAAISFSDTHVSEAEYAGGYAACLTELLMVLLATAPTYFVLAYGLIMTTLRSTQDPLVTTSSAADPAPEPGNLQLGRSPA